MTDTQLHPEEPQIKPENILKSAEAPNVLFINASYNFTADFKMLVIRSKLALFPSLCNPKYASSNREAKHLADFDNCIYKNNYLFKVDLNKQTASDKEALEIWVEDGGKLIEEAIIEGTSEIPKLIKKSLENPAKRTRTVIYKKD